MARSLCPDWQVLDEWGHAYRQAIYQTINHCGFSVLLWSSLDIQ